MNKWTLISRFENRNVEEFKNKKIMRFILKYIERPVNEWLNENFHDIHHQKAKIKK